MVTVLVEPLGLLVAESTQVSSEEEGLMERKWTSYGAGAMLTFLELGTGVLTDTRVIVTGCLHIPKPPVFLSLLDVMTAPLFCFFPDLIILRRGNQNDLVASHELGPLVL